MNHPVLVDVQHGIATLTLNRPQRANALDVAGWHALRQAFADLDRRTDVRVAVLQGAGPHFCAGIDLSVLLNLRTQCDANTGCDGLDRERICHWIEDLQDCVTAIERCRVPVIAAIQGVCFGGGVDIATACDMRYATHDARLCVKEIDLAITADLGVLQRLPHLVGDARARELVYTAREIDGAQAERMGLVGASYASAEALHAGVAELARTLAGKSPLALRGTKRALLHARDAGVHAGLRQVAEWNAAALLSQDLTEALAAHREKRPPVYRDGPAPR